MSDALRFTVEITDSGDAEWLKDAVARSGLSQREFLRGLIRGARLGAHPLPESSHLSDPGPWPTLGSLPRAPLAPPCDPARAWPEDPKERFLAALEEAFGERLAAQRAGVTPAELRKWLKKPAFQASCADRKAIFIEIVQEHLVSVGRGTRKGNASALTAFLAAVTPHYGLLKANFLHQILQPLLDAIAAALDKELPGNAAGQEVKTRILQRVAGVSRDLSAKLPGGAP